MSRKDTPQAALEVLVLNTLSRGPNHGFGITLHIEQASGELLRIEEGSLYPALHRLERDGLVAAEWQTTDKGRRAKFYRLTSLGEARLGELERSWNAMSEGVARVLRFA
jgi:PadR family transcriptional regulator PadR